MSTIPQCKNQKWVEGSAASFEDAAQGKTWFWERGERGSASGSDSSDRKAQGPKGGDNAVKVRHILCGKTWESHGSHGKVKV